MFIFKGYRNQSGKRKVAVLIGNMDPSQPERLLGRQGTYLHRRDTASGASKTDMHGEKL